MILKSVCLGLLLAAMSSIEGKVVSVATPVLFTNNDGGGSDELQVPNGKSTTRLYCTSGPVNYGWYTPYDNINDLSAIATLDIIPQGNCVQLYAGGYSNPRDARVRIRIYADIED